MLAKNRKMVRLHKELDKTMSHTGLSKHRISKLMGFHHNYLYYVLNQGVTIEKEREIVKKLKEIKVDHYINIRKTKEGTHIHVKDTSVESNKLKKENEDLKKQLLSLQDNQQRVNTANETTIQNLHSRVQEHLGAYQSGLKEIATLKRQIRDLTEKNLYLRDENKTLNELFDTEKYETKLLCEIAELTKEVDILRGDLESKKVLISQLESFNINSTNRVTQLRKDVKQKQERIEQLEVELGKFLFNPKQDVVLEKKLFGFNIVVSKGDK